MTMDDLDVARVLQAWLSEGHTLPDCLASLVVCAREGRLTPSNKLVTMDAVRAGFQLWRARREERAALLGVLASWSESQRRGVEAAPAGHGVPAGRGGRGGRRARSVQAPADGDGKIAAAGTLQAAMVTANENAADANATPCLTTEDGPPPPATVACAQERTEGGKAGRPAAATPTKTTRARRRFSQRPRGAAETGSKRFCTDVSGVAQSSRTA